MRQARLVAGFQREHLPSEESGEESRLIHPGHTSISSLYDWVGCFFLLLFFFRLLSRFAIWWPWGPSRGTAPGESRSSTLGTPPCSVSLSRGQGLQAGEAGKDGAGARAGSTACALQSIRICDTAPCLSFPT